MKITFNFPEEYKGGAGSGNFGHSGRPGQVGGSGGSGGGSGVSAGSGALRQHKVEMPTNAVMSVSGLSATFKKNLVTGAAGKKLSQAYLKSFSDKAVKGKVAQVKSGDFAGAFVRIHGVGGMEGKKVKFEGSIINGKGRESWDDNLLVFDSSVFD